MTFLKQLFSVRTYLPKFFACLSSLWIVLKPIHELLSLHSGWYEYIVLLVLSIIVAMAWNWPRAIVKHRFSHNDVTIRIVKGDVLKADNNIVIGFCDTFDTQIGKIIKANSLQGQFQSQVFNGDAAALDECLGDLLAEELKFAIHDPDKLHGKKLRFPVGTVLTLTHGKRYFLLVYSIMGNDLACIPTTPENVTNALYSLWAKVRCNGQHDPVSIPVIASDAARSGLSRAVLIKLILLTFYTAHEANPITKALDIYVHPNDIEHVDFNAIETFITSI